MNNISPNIDGYSNRNLVKNEYRIVNKDKIKDSLKENDL